MIMLKINKERILEKKKSETQEFHWIFLDII